MTNHSTEFTLRGYVEIIRRRGWLIVIVAVVCAAAAFGYSKVKTPTYTATSSLTVNDPNTALSYTGSSFYSGETPLQQASAAAPQVTRPEVVAAVDRKLGPTASKSSVAVAVDPNSDVINITASSHSAAEAAAITNSFANADVALSNAEARAAYRAQAASVERQLAHLKPLSAQAVIAQSTLGRLENLAAVATPLNISTTATVPGSPSSPKPLTYTLAALLFGLLLGIAIAIARDALDRRMRSSGDVSHVLDHPVIGHIRTEALGHAGAPGESLNGSGPLDDPDQEAFRILRQNIAYLGPAADSRTLLVTSAVGSEGKSTVAACLAVATAEAGKRTLLVECDLRKPVLANRFGIKDGPGLTDYLIDNADPHEILQPILGIAERLNGSGSAIGQHAGSNLVCITAGRIVHRPAELLASERFHDFVAQVSDVYDTVILDTAPLLPVADTLAIVPDVTALIVCVRLEQTTSEQARAAQSALHRLPERPVGLVLTDVRPEDDGYYHSYYGTQTPQ